MTPYNTGKVKIGATYTPRPRPEYSHGFSGPHKRPFFDKVDTPVMKACLLAAIAFVVIVLTGCGGAPRVTVLCGLDGNAYSARFTTDAVAQLRRMPEGDPLCAKLKAAPTT
jgi:hypothetical protein